MCGSAGRAKKQGSLLTFVINAENMKTMTCQQLGGACNQPFSANTFDEIAMMASQHGRAMVQQGDSAHIEAMNDMRNSMATPEVMNAWMDEKRKAFNSLPDDNG